MLLTLRTPWVCLLFVAALLVLPVDARAITTIPGPEAIAPIDGSLAAVDAMAPCVKTRIDFFGCDSNTVRFVVPRRADGECKYDDVRLSATSAVDTLGRLKDVDWGSKPPTTAETTDPTVCTFVIGPWFGPGTHYWQASGFKFGPNCPATPTGYEPGCEFRDHNVLSPVRSFVVNEHLPIVTLRINAWRSKTRLVYGKPGRGAKTRVSLKFDTTGSNNFFVLLSRKAVRSKAPARSETVLAPAYVEDGDFYTVTRDLTPGKYFYRIYSWSHCEDVNDPDPSDDDPQKMDEEAGSWDMCREISRSLSVIVSKAPIRKPRPVPGTPTPNTWPPKISFSRSVFFGSTCAMQYCLVDMHQKGHSEAEARAYCEWKFG